MPYLNQCVILIKYFKRKGADAYVYCKKTLQTYIFVYCALYICVLYQYSSDICSHTFTQSFNSGFPNDIYTTSAASSNDDACTPEMLGRQELYSYSNIVHKKNNFSHTYRLLLYITDIVDTIHFPSYYYLSEYLSGICEPKSTENIIDYIHLQDGKKKY